MEIQVNNRNVALTNGQQELIERRLQFALGRFASQVRSAHVVLNDVNGPKGGNDIQCSLKVNLVKQGEIFVSDTHVSLEVAIANAADRAGRSVARFLDRQRRRQGPSMSGQDFSDV